MIRTYKIRNEDLEIDSFEASCWYNAQKVFTGMIRKGLKGYIYCVDRGDVESFGWDWKGVGYYGSGDALLDTEIISTFFDGEKTLTINVKR